MRFMSFRIQGRTGLAIVDGTQVRGIFADDRRFPGNLASLLNKGGSALHSAADELRKGTAVDLGAVEHLPFLGETGKIICLGINYVAHVKETGNEIPRHPTVFARFGSSLIGHRAALVCPKVSRQFDYEGELVAVIGQGGRHIPLNRALDHVVGYSIFNDATVRDYQFETPQWTVGKNFDGSGALGPLFVTADEVPPGGKGLKLQTRLNGTVVQQASTSEMIFDVANCVAFLSEAMTLRPGDLLVTGTPPGVGWARKPQLFMKPGDRCEVEIEGLGTLINEVVAEK